VTCEDGFVNSGRPALLLFSVLSLGAAAEGQNPTLDRSRIHHEPRHLRGAIEWAVGVGQRSGEHLDM